MTPDPQQQQHPAPPPASAAERTTRNRPLRRALLAARLVVWSLLLVLTLLVFTPLGDRFGAGLVQLDPLAPADYIVVLDGDNARAVEAARLYRNGLAPKVILSSTSRQCAEELARITIAYGVAPGDIVLEGTSQRTADHPAGVAALPRVEKETQRFIVVTSAYHTARARQCFERQGFRHLVMHSPDWERFGQFGATRPIRWQERLAALPAKFHEIGGLLYYRLCGWI